MSPFRRNLVANIAGTGSLALVQLACVPLYIHFLGIEAYGLIGFAVMLQAALRVFDFGLSPTMNREMARYSVQAGRAEEMRDFVRTVEVGYWLVGVVAGVAIGAAAPLIATRWINAGSLPLTAVEQSVALMGAVVAAQWPLSLYQSVLVGLQRQVALNGIRVASALLGGGGSLLVLWLLSPTITAFFAWQVFVCLLEVACLALYVWRVLPPASRRARLDVAPVRRVVRFAGGMSGIAISGMILTQMDKVILSGLLSLEAFAHYTLAGLVASSLHLFIGPVFAATFPRLSACVAAGDHAGMPRVYHVGTQLMAVLVFPLALTLAFFAPEVLRLWTGDALLAQQTAPILVFLVAGTAINGVMFMPFALQIAYGWTNLALSVSVAMCVAMVPAVWFMGSRYGAAGAAAVWLALNLLNFLVAFPLTHRRLLRSEARNWIVRDVTLPLVAAAATVWSAWYVLPIPAAAPVAILVLVLCCLAAFLAAAVGATQVRPWIFGPRKRVAAAAGGTQA